MEQKTWLDDVVSCREASALDIYYPFNGMKWFRKWSITRGVRLHLQTADFVSMAPEMSWKPKRTANIFYDSKFIGETFFIDFKHYGYRLFLNSR